MSESPSSGWSGSRRLARYRVAIANLGWRHWLALQARRMAAKMTGSRSPLIVTSRYSKYPLYWRPATSDLHVFRQIFVEREYQCLDDLRDVGLVIDCGANVGYSSAYFLSQFPGCVVIAIEPDSANFEMLRRNLSPYGDRARMIHAGVWPHDASLRISDAVYRDGGEWARQVVECGPEEATSFPAVCLAGLLEDSGYDRISILKVDIEGAEALVFAENYEGWIDRTDIMAVELHDDTVFGDARGSFARAISGRGFSESHSGELTICRRLGHGMECAEK